MLSQQTRDLMKESVRYMYWLSEKVVQDRVDIMDHLAELTIEAEEMAKMAREAKTSLTQ